MTDAQAGRRQQALDFAEHQVARLIERSPDFFPIYTVEGRWRHAGPLWTDWTGGFLTGMMWHFFQRTGNPAWRDRAEHYCRLLEPRKADPNVHDLGFIFLNSYWPWYEATRQPLLRDVLVEAARTLASRFQAKGHYLCSFLGTTSLFIDIMMNVPLIAYAANETGDADLARIAREHCRTTRNRLVRPDGSTAHEGIFAPASGAFLGESTQQGLQPDSCWARGLAWSMYGFSKMYALTGNAEFLDVAERNAAYWLQHLPDDSIPYWDFQADPAAPLPWGGQKDSSAAAIAASALWDLASQTASAERGMIYHNGALVMLDRLCSPGYLAEDIPSWEGILKHGVYHTRKNLGVDESVMWGEFYFVEALMKTERGTP